jgi:hypothetical protein
MGDCREGRIENKVLNRFKKATCGGVHANNYKTFRRTHLDQSPSVETWISCLPLNGIPLENFHIESMIVLLYKILSSTNNHPSLTMSG